MFLIDRWFLYKFHFVINQNEDKNNIVWSFVYDNISNLAYILQQMCTLNMSIIISKRFQKQLVNWQQLQWFIDRWSTWVEFTSPTYMERWNTMRRVLKCVAFTNRDANGLRYVRFKACWVFKTSLEKINSTLQCLIIQTSVQTVGRIKSSRLFCGANDDRGCGVFLFFITKRREEEEKLMLSMRVIMDWKKSNISNSEETDFKCASH